MATRSVPGGPGDSGQPPKPPSRAAITPPRSVLDPEALALGSRIRGRRRDLGLSLVKLAEVTGLSHPFLSQVERGHARPSVTSLQRIATALEIDAGWLFAGPHAERAAVQLVRVEDTQPLRVVESQHEGTVRAFRADGWSTWFFDVIELPDTYGDYLRARADSICYVLEGTLDVDVDGVVYQLGPSDALFVDAHLPHRFRSTSGERTHLIVFRVQDGADSP